MNTVCLTLSAICKFWGMEQRNKKGKGDRAREAEGKTNLVTVVRSGRRALARPCQLEGLRGGKQPDRCDVQPHSLVP